MTILQLYLKGFELRC